MKIDLRNGSTTTDPRLDRIEAFDEESKLYRILTLGQDKPASVQWDCQVQLDQGKEGACVGFGIGHTLSAAGYRNVDNNMARSLYWLTQVADPWEGGAYPGAKPFYQGTSVLHGLKTAKEIGLIKSYNWAFGLGDVLAGLQRGPGVLGCTWLQSMQSPDADGFITYDGNEVGGHCACVKGCNMRHEFVIIRNSWGSGWGSNGDCYMSFADFTKLLAAKGEVAFIQR